MFDANEKYLLHQACEELRQIKTEADFYRIVHEVQKKYPLCISYAAREIEHCYNAGQYARDV